MKNLIVYPTDFSRCAENALTFAVPLAKVLNCTLKVVHYIDFIGISDTEAHYRSVLEEIGKIEREASIKLKKLQRQVEKQEVKCEFQVIKGRNISEHTEFLEELDPRFVVMGTTGSGSFENKVMGSLTYKVIKHTYLPVLAIPEKATFQGIRKIVFATDYENKDLDSIGSLAEIAKHFNAAIEVVHICEDPDYDKSEQVFFDDYRKFISKRTDYQNIDFKLLHWKNVEERLAIFLNDSQADLLAMITRKRNFFDRLFHGSLAKKMIYHTHIPLFVYS